MKAEKKQLRRELRQEKRDYTRRQEAVVSQARLSNHGTSALKARLLADLIRDKAVGRALEILTHAVKPSVQPAMLALLKSAIAGVDREVYNDEDVLGLVVGEVFVDSALVVKRFRPRAMGRINRIRKRTCHITLRLTDPRNLAAARQARRGVAAATTEAEA